MSLFLMHDLLAVSLIFFTAIFTMIFKLISRENFGNAFIFDSLDWAFYNYWGSKGLNADLHPVIESF